MRDGLLSIGEVACMKGVSLKSLRYYESLGIFTPAFVDPSSGYRYYSLNQLMDLDAITTCIELGIPLKELRGYKEPSGMLDLAALLERGKSEAVRRIAQAQVVLAQVSAQLDEISAQAAFARAEEPYARSLPRGSMLVQPWRLPAFDTRRYAQWMTDAYAAAFARGVVPSYVQGFLFEPAACAFDEADVSVKSREVRVFTYLEILPGVSCAESPMPCAGEPRAASPLCESQPEDGIELRDFPGGEFRGRRIRARSLAECFDAAFAQAREAGVRARAVEVWDAHLAPDSYVVELCVQAR